MPFCQMGSGVKHGADVSPYTMHGNHAIPVAQILCMVGSYMEDFANKFTKLSSLKGGRGWVLVWDNEMYTKVM